ncbi:MAG TPA: class I SAM-dependent methyltransferase, partial [Vicinamibacterales bacterium]
MKREGWQGWDTYAPFYDWENAQTLGRRDVPFWRRVAAGATGPVLELGCGTGRVSLPLARAGVNLIGIDRSEPMLERARRRILRTSRSKRRISADS